MADKGKAVAGNDGPVKRQRRAREEALEDTATSGGNETLQELPRVTAATSPVDGVPSGFSQTNPVLQPPVGNPAFGRRGGGGSGSGRGGLAPPLGNTGGADNGPPPLHTLAKPAPPPERQFSSRAREHQLQAMRLQVGRPNPGLLNNPGDNGPPQRQSVAEAARVHNNLGRAIIERAQLEFLLRTHNILPPPCNACGRPSGTNINACRLCRQSSPPACYNNLFTGNGPPQHAQIGKAVKPNEPSNFLWTIRQYTSSLNFVSLETPEEIDTFSEEFDSYQKDGRLGCAPLVKGQRPSKTKGSSVQCPTTATVNSVSVRVISVPPVK
ncbi:hypothetical protein ZWY2020_018475 [Hordeum vulgare]|nr:hypothetical protein ZWY2020_018475 [Hordeum vulgare]